MMQRILTRINQNPTIERQELAASVPTPWDTPSNYHRADHAISRTSTIDVEKGFLDSKDKGELQPLLAAPSGSNTTLAALKSPKISRTGLATVQQPLDHKGPKEWAAIRRSAAENRDARFARSTASLLHSASLKKPGGCSEISFGFMYDVKLERNLHLTKVSNRLSILEEIHSSIEPDHCRFNKKQAEAYACEIIKEFTCFFQTISVSVIFCPKMTEIFTERVAKLIDAIACDKETEKEIQFTFRASVLHQVWQLAVAAQSDGRTSDLERYLSLHAEWQDTNSASGRR